MDFEIFIAMKDFVCNLLREKGFSIGGFMSGNIKHAERGLVYTVCEFQIREPMVIKNKQYELVVELRELPGEAIPVPQSKE